MFEINIDNQNRVYVSWSGEEIRSSDGADGVLQINGLYGSNLGLKDGDDVSIQGSNLSICLTSLLLKVAVSLLFH